MAVAAASASSLSKKPAMVMVVMMVMVMVMGAQASTQHEVGGTPGWTTIGNVDYTAWAENQTFVVGDTLLFSYNSSFHNVLEVSKTDYDNCRNSSPIHTWSDGKTIIALNSTGTQYYLCGFPGHCTLGQKVAITVLSSSSASNSSSAAMPSLTLPPSALPIITLTAVLSLTIALL